MKLARSRNQTPPISLVSMIDVLMIMLIFFMVTSTYLDLRMMPVAERSEDPAPSPANQEAPTSTILIRLGPDGIAHIQGRPYDRAGLQALLFDRLATAPATTVIVLPSGVANTQSLVTLLDTATTVGVTRLRVLQLEARP